MCESCGYDLDGVAWLPTAAEYEAREATPKTAERTAALVEEARVARDEAEFREFRSPRVLGQVFQLWVIGGMLVDLVYGVLSVVHYGLLDDGVLRDSDKLDEAAASEDRLALLFIPEIAVFLVTAIFFIAWFNRAYKNLPALGCVGRRRGTSATVWAWFVPIAAWIIPKQIANEIWRCSCAGERERDTPWRVRTVPLWVHLWWALWVIGSFLGNVSARVYGDSTDLDSERASTVIDIVATPFYLASAVLVWLLVDRISKGQEAAAAAVDV